MREFGKLANLLKIHTFFRSTMVWHEIASDEHYKKWCSTRKCIINNSLGGDGNQVVAFSYHNLNDDYHRVKYSSVPVLRLTAESILLKGVGEFGGDEFFRKARIKCVSEWGWIHLKARLGYESWGDIPPSEVCEWASDHNVFSYLPESYKKEFVK